MKPVVYMVSTSPHPCREPYESGRTTKKHQPGHNSFPWEQLQAFTHVRAGVATSCKVGSRKLLERLRHDVVKAVVIETRHIGRFIWKPRGSRYGRRDSTVTLITTFLAPCWKACRFRTYQEHFSLIHRVRKLHVKPTNLNQIVFEYAGLVFNCEIGIKAKPWCW